MQSPSPHLALPHLQGPAIQTSAPASADRGSAVLGADMPTCPVTTAENNHLDRLEAKEMALDTASANLSAQVICAMFGNPLEASIDLPKQKQWSAVEMLSDHFAGKSGDTDLAEFVSLVAGLAKQFGNPLQPRAFALLNRIADEYGAYWCDVVAA